jgi:hypothetical protein
MHGSVASIVGRRIASTFLVGPAGARVATSIAKEPRSKIEWTCREIACFCRKINMACRKIALSCRKFDVGCRKIRLL